MDRRVTPPKRVTSPTWGPPPPLLTVPQTVSTFPTVESPLFEESSLRQFAA